MVDLKSERLSEVRLLALAAATHGAVFAAPFALIGAGFGEWQRIGSWIYYVLVAIAIAGIGFLAQYWTEAQGQASIVNNYAVTAFLRHRLRRRLGLLVVCGALCARAREAAGDRPTGEACGGVQWAVGADCDLSVERTTSGVAISSRLAHRPSMVPGIFAFRLQLSARSLRRCLDGVISALVPKSRGG